jgi:hypothetical protein
VRQPDRLRAQAGTAGPDPLHPDATTGGVPGTLGSLQSCRVGRECEWTSSAAGETVAAVIAAAVFCRTPARALSYEALPMAAMTTMRLG